MSRVTPVDSQAAKDSTLQQIKTKTDNIDILVSLLLRNLKFPETEPLSDDTLNPSLTKIQSFMMGFDGINWDRLRLDALMNLNTRMNSWLGSTAPTIGQKAMASSIPVTISSDQSTLNVLLQALAAGNNSTQANVSLGSNTGKTNVMRTGSLITTATTVDQVVHTYTVTAGRTFYLFYLILLSRLTTLSTTASILGTASLETPSGTKTITLDFVNPTTSDVRPHIVVFPEPVPISAGTVVRVVCTPNAVTSMLWRANFGGYEK